MSNTRQVEPKIIWTPQGEKTITIFAISNLSEYHFDNSAAKIEYKLIYMKDNGVQTITNEEDGSVTTIPLPQSAEELITDTLLIPASIIQEWGTDDNIIFEYATTTLGFFLI